MLYTVYTVQYIVYTPSKQNQLPVEAVVLEMLRGRESED